jgi:hypothetical protein
MTPEQYAYYQQPQQQEEGGLLDFLGKAALAAGAVAGGIAGTRYLRGRMAQQAPPREAKRPGAPNYEAVRRAAATQMPENPKVTRSQTPPSPGSTADRVRRMEQITREARAERMPGVIQTDLASLVAQTGAPSPSLSAVPVSATPVRPVTGPIVTDLSRLQGQATELPSTYYSRQPGSFADITSAQREITGVNAAERLSQDPELLSLVRQQKTEELSEARSMQAKAQAEYRNLLSEKADEAIQSVRAEPKNFLQERLEQSGYVPTQVEKQQSTAPVISDQSVNAVYSAEDQQTGRVKQQLQRNEDVDLSRVDLMEDMAEADRQAMIQNADPSEMIGYEADASINQIAAQLPDGRPVDQAEQTATRSLSSQELADIAKTEMMALRQDLASRGLRPGTQRFERALAQSWTTKSLPGVQPGTQEFRRLQELGKVDISLPSSVRKAVDVVGVGADPTGFVPERTVVNIGPQAQITSTAAGTAIRGASPSYYEAMPITRERQLTGTGDPLVYGAPDEMGPDIPGSARVTASLPSDIPQSALSKQEIKYSFLNKPPQPELPGGSAGIGVYGIEPAYVPGAVSKATGEYSAASERQPSYVPGWLQRKQMRSGFESLTTPQLQAAAEKTTGRIQQSFQGEMQRRRAAQEGLAVSEALRRSRIEGRDPQMILRQLKIGN